jgi:hypothetical protein
MPLSEGWRDQFERMLRGRTRLATAAGPSAIGSDEARDILYHFFQDAYHLKEWIKNSPTNDPRIAKAGAVVEDLFDPVSGLPHMQVTAEVCNGIKHLVSTYPAMTGDKTTAITNQDVAVTPMTVYATTWVFPGSPAKPASPLATTSAGHRWTITSKGQKRNAVDLADDVVAEWEKWLTKHKLLP